MSDKNFEQDRTYHDMDGNLRNFTIRDYSKKPKVAMTNVLTDEQKAQVEKDYDDSTYTIIDDLMEQVPAVFGREVDMAIDIVDDRIEWNRNALFLMFRDPDRFHYSSGWSTLQRTIYKNIKEHIFCNEDDCREKVEAWKEEYAKTKTL